MWHAQKSLQEVRDARCQLARHLCKTFWVIHLDLNEWIHSRSLDVASKKFTEASSRPESFSEKYQDSTTQHNRRL